MSVATRSEWLESLPSNCPPDSATPPDNFVCYRLVESVPPMAKDFYSHRKLFPKKIFNTNECRSRSLSINTDLEAVKKINMLAPHRDKFLGKFTLSSDCGEVKQTGKEKTHYSLWLKESYSDYIEFEVA